MTHDDARPPSAAGRLLRWLALVRTADNRLTPLRDPDGRWAELKAATRQEAEYLASALAPRDAVVIRRRAFERLTARRARRARRSAA